MKTALLVLSGFTALAAAWLVVMYFVLQHPGFEWRAAVAALFVVQSVLTLAALGGAVSGGWVSPLLLTGAVGIAWAGGSAVAATLNGPHFEGFALVIGLALAVQGLLTAVVFLLKLQDGRLAGWQN